jgi:P4 family phage/plasmid primase-like protien
MLPLSRWQRRGPDLRGGVMDQLTPKTATDIKVALDFIHQHFSNTEHPVFICSLPNDKSDRNEPGERHIATRDDTMITDFIGKWDRPGRGLFFCVSTIRTNMKRNKESVVEIPGLWADIDFKDVIDNEITILGRVKTLPLPPTTIVRSGNGLHLYWQFKEAIIIDGAETVEQIEAATKLLADLCGGDMKVTQIVALMRLPGTHNSKYDGWKGVGTESMRGGGYELDDIEEMLAVKSPVVLRKVRPAQDGESNPYLEAAKALGYKPPVDVEKRLAEMTYMGGDDAAIHGTQVSVTASLLNAGAEIDDVVSVVLAATKTAAGDYGSRWNWKREEKAIRGMCLSWIKKHPEIKSASATPLGTGATVHKLDDARKKVNTKADTKADTPDDDGSNSKGKLPLSISIALTFVEWMKKGEKLRRFADKHGRLHFCKYENGLWSVISDGEITRWLIPKLQAVLNTISREKHSTIKILNEAAQHVIRHADVCLDEQIQWNNHGKVPTLDGLVDPFTLEIEPFKPEHYATWCLNAHYDRTAKCPFWERMLRDSFGDKSPDDRDTTITLVQDISGLSLIDNKPKSLRTALVLWGPGDTGKTSLAKVLGGLLSDDPITTPLADLNNAHGTQAFLRRAPWVLGEAFNPTGWNLSDRVKSIISGDEIEINPKNQKAISIKVNAPPFWCTNHSPKFKEPTGTMVERMTIVHVTRVFDKGHPVGVAADARRINPAWWPYDLVLTNEKPGLLNWALAGLKRALERGRLVNTADGAGLLDEVRDESNIVRPFIRECVAYDFTLMVSAIDFQAALMEWWKENHGDDLKPPSPALIGSHLKALADPRILQNRDVFKTEDGKRYYLGIRLNKVGLEHWNTAHTEQTVNGHTSKTLARISASELDVIQPVPAKWATRPEVEALRNRGAK